MNEHRIRAKLIFNSGSRVADESPVQLMDVIRAMQACKLVPEAYLVEPDCDLPAAIAILSNPQANEMRLATYLRFPRVCQLGVNLEQ
jgi:hypothetical protein